MNHAYRLTVSRKAAQAVRRGHPWVFREGDVPAPGSLVELVADETVIGWGLADEGTISVRVLGRGRAPADLSQVIFERIREADAARWRLMPPRTDCWRVVHGPGDGLPGLVIDRYADLAVLRLYSAAWLAHKESIVRAVRALGWVQCLYRRLGVVRVDGQRGGGECWLGGPVPESLVVEENGMRLLVRPLIGQKTGMFLDQRAHRSLVRGWASGRIVANLFAYNGGFSVAAALGGAAHVTTVDIAPEAVEDARENFRLNGLDPADHAFEVADVFKWKPRHPVDLMVVDPPSLTRGERSDKAARKAYRSLHDRLAPHVTRGGLVATASCTARLSLADWRDAVSEGLSAKGEWSWHHVSVEPADHPVALHHREGRYLKFALLRRR